MTSPSVLTQNASAEAVLSREDRDNGAVVVDIGEQLTHLGIFLHGTLFHSAVIPIGGAHFTRDLEITKHLGGIAAGFALYYLLKE